MIRPITLPIVVLLAALVAGCGETQIDSGKAEDLARKVAGTGTVKLESVSCPDGIKAKKGEDFKCDLKYADGATGTITIHQEDDNGSVRTNAQDIHVQGG
jgi:hypothetical protein